MIERMLLPSIKIVALMRIDFNEGKTIPFSGFIGMRNPNLGQTISLKFSENGHALGTSRNLRVVMGKAKS